MKKNNYYLAIEIASDTKTIETVLNMLPGQPERKRNIGEGDSKTNRPNDMSTLRYIYRDTEAFDADLFITSWLSSVSTKKLIEISRMGYSISIVFIIEIYEREIPLPDAGLSCETIKVLASLGADYHVAIEI